MCACVWKMGIPPLYLAAPMSPGIHACGSVVKLNAGYFALYEHPGVIPAQQFGFDPSSHAIFEVEFLGTPKRPVPGHGLALMCRHIHVLGLANTTATDAWEVVNGRVHGALQMHGIQYTFFLGQLHSYGDRPAYVHRGLQMWYRHGQVHRDGDKPAIRRSDGKEEWYSLGRRHRDGDRPALVMPPRLGTQGLWEWYENGARHRPRGKPAIVRGQSCSDFGSCEFWEQGQRHRDSEPAVVYAWGCGELWVRGKFCGLVMK